MIIEIDLEGGLVQAVRIDQACDAEVRVRDYDIEGLADNETYIDDNGVQYDLSFPHCVFGEPAGTIRKTILSVSVAETDELEPHTAEMELHAEQLSRLALALAPHSDTEVCRAPGVLCAYCPLKEATNCSNEARIAYLKKQEA